MRSENTDHQRRFGLSDHKRRRASHFRARWGDRIHGRVPGKHRGQGDELGWLYYVNKIQDNNMTEEEARLYEATIAAT